MTIDIPSVVNFRDGGGLPSGFGGRLKSGWLYRSGNPSSATPEDLARLVALDFNLIADLRYGAERQAEPHPWPEHLAGRLVQHLGGEAREAPHYAALRDGSMDEAVGHRLYEEIYREVPFDAEYKPVLDRLIHELTEGEGPMLLHCAAGKDRTGMFVALIQHALGVPQDEIFANFLLSNQDPGLPELAMKSRAAVEAKFGHRYSPELMMTLIAVHEDYLKAFIDEIERRAGSIDAYLEAAGLDQARRDKALQRWLEG
jgi:protein-tyrosine phosphatase